MTEPRPCTECGSAVGPGEEAHSGVRVQDDVVTHDRLCVVCVEACMRRRMRYEALCDRLEEEARGR